MWWWISFTLPRVLCQKGAWKIRVQNCRWPYWHVAFINLCDRRVADCSIEAQRLDTRKAFISVLKLSFVSLNRWLTHKYQKAEVVKSVWRHLVLQRQINYSTLQKETLSLALRPRQAWPVHALAHNGESNPNLPEQTWLILMHKRPFPKQSFWSNFLWLFSCHQSINLQKVRRQIVKKKKSSPTGNLYWPAPN